jgi:AcrR family transcriptional regulator
MARRPTPGARERILDRAACLFSEHGINAVGLQQVIDECGCGKNLLYREFASKDELVVAYLERMRAQSNADIDAAVAKFADDPAGQLVAVVQTAVDSASAPDYRGCPFHTATAEFRDPDHPVHRVSVEHIASVRRRLRAIAKKAGAASPNDLADRLMLLIEGVYSSGSMLGRRGPVSGAVQFADDLVHQATSSRATR